MAEINDRWLQFSGKVLIPDEPDTERYAIIAGEFEFGDKVVKRIEADGLVDEIYKVAPIRVAVEVGDKRIRAKVKGRSSQRLRGALWHEFQNTSRPEEEFDDWYNHVIDKIIVHLAEVQAFLGELN